MALVPLSVSRSMYTSSERSWKVLYPARRIACRRCSKSSCARGSTILMRYGSGGGRVSSEDGKEALPSPGLWILYAECTTSRVFDGGSGGSRRGASRLLRERRHEARG